MEGDVMSHYHNDDFTREDVETELQETEILVSELLATIEYASRTIGQLLDEPITKDMLAMALSRALSALGGTYYKATGKPLEWWQGEYIYTVNGVNGISNT
tara:strand:- start:272 stop:574 length:303 start_codon:yes stop_codon:yes gene_type:complete